MQADATLDKDAPHSNPADKLLLNILMQTCIQEFGDLLELTQTYKEVLLEKGGRSSMECVFAGGEWVTLGRSSGNGAFGTIYDSSSHPQVRDWVRTRRVTITCGPACSNRGSHC